MAVAILTFFTLRFDVHPNFVPYVQYLCLTRHSSSHPSHLRRLVWGLPCMTPHRIHLQKLNLQAAGLKLHASR